MKIDATRFSMFWSNPERYRIRQEWKLSPIPPKAGSFQHLLQFGRRRGTCLHELRDAHYQGVPEAEAVQSLKDGGYEQKEIDIALEMSAALEERYKGVEVLAHEVLFDMQIPDSPHSITGRIDRIVRIDNEVLIDDYKTCGKTTKKEFQKRADGYLNSAQVPFYLIGAASLGEAFNSVRQFRYCLVQQTKHGVAIEEFRTSRTGLDLTRFLRSVEQTCDLIEFLKRGRYGIEKPWPRLWEKYDRGYGTVEGLHLYTDYVPDGFEPATEHLESMSEDWEADDD